MPCIWCLQRRSTPWRPISGSQTLRMEKVTHSKATYSKPKSVYICSHKTLEIYFKVVGFVLLGGSGPFTLWSGLLYICVTILLAGLRGNSTAQWRNVISLGRHCSCTLMCSCIYLQLYVSVAVCICSHRSCSNIFIPKRHAEVCFFLSALFQTPAHAPGEHYTI